MEEITVFDYIESLEKTVEKQSALIETLQSLIKTNDSLAEFRKKRIIEILGEDKEDK